MLTEKKFKDLAKNGITFSLSANGKYANIYCNGQFVNSIFRTNNSVYFCGKTFVETTTRDIIDFLDSNCKLPEDYRKLNREELFIIWKRCILENRSTKSMEIEYSTTEFYIDNAFRKMNLPHTMNARNRMGRELLIKLLGQDSYKKARKFLFPKEDE